MPSKIKTPSSPVAAHSKKSGVQTRAMRKASSASSSHAQALHGTLARHHEIVAGAQKHLQQNLKDPRQQALIKQHEKSQQPEYFILSCADSRYDPTNVFQMESGRLFVYRNAGNMVTGEKDSARFDVGMAGTLAYALQVLKIKHIVVLGHTGCGLVKAVMDDARAEGKPKPKGGGLHDWTTTWMSHAGHLKRQVDAHYDFSSTTDQDLAAVGEHVLRQVERLRSLNIVRDAFEQGILQDIVGAVYEIHNDGNTSIWDDDQEKFVSMSPEHASSLPERHSKRDD